MKKPSDKRSLIYGLFSFFALGLSGCSTAGGAAADLGLAGAGGTIGYQLTDHKIGGAAAGAAVGYVASKVVQSEVRQTVQEAEKRGFDQAMNQAVKQQYWIIQNQQRSRETVDEREPRLLPVVIPETKINGVLQKAHAEYLRVEP
jgi:hypothetical protein